MKFTCTTTINCSRKKVIELFEDTELRKQYQEGFLSLTPIHGELGAVGSTSKIMFQTPKGPQELIETILKNDLPHEFTGRYEHQHMVNTMQNKFTALGANETRYDAIVEYTKFKGFFIKMMAFLMPSMFKKQVQKHLDQLKIFAEKQA